MKDVTIDGIRLFLEAPSSVSRQLIDPNHPAYDPFATELKLTMENISGHPIDLPFDEITTGVVRVYSTPANDEPVVDNVVPPPPNDGALIKFEPGEKRELRSGIGYPADLIQFNKDQAVALTVCLRWRAEWLRVKNYVPGSVEWNHDFDVCNVVSVKE